MNDRRPHDPDATDRAVALHILDALPQAVFWKDRESVYIGCNRAYTDAVGLVDKRDIVGKTDFELSMTEVQAEGYRRDDEEVMSTGEPKHGILETMTFADGRQVQVETTKIPFTDDTGAVIGVLGVFTDVTERERRAVELREARHILRTVLDTIPVRVFWKDRGSVYLGGNRLFAADAGLDDPEDLVGMTDMQLGFAEQAELYRKDDAEVMMTGEAKLGYEEPQTTPEGGRIWLRTSKVPLRDLDEGIIGVLGTYEDVTAAKEAEEERRRLEARIQHAQKLESLGILAGGIAHDFNNLLVAMLGHADMALEDLPPSAPGRRSIEEIRTAAKRARELTNQMLAYSGKGRFVVQPLQMNEVVTEIGHLLEASIPKKVKLRYDLTDDLPAVEADVAQVRQIVMNLVTNAAEAVGEGQGRISVTTGHMQATDEYFLGMDLQDPLPAGRYVCLEISDDGCGMETEVLERLFEPFFTTKFQGRGLGLAAVQGIVNGHGGGISVTSEPGKGSSFKVLLPASENVEAVPVATPGRVGTGEPLAGTVLVVDDEDLVLQVATQMLAHMGFETVTACDGAEALEVFEQHREEVRLVLLDMTMPRMDGEETFRELRVLDPEVRVILTSGYNEQDTTSRFAGKGLAGFIQKPFTLTDLEAKIREGLA